MGPWLFCTHRYDFVGLFKQVETAWSVTLLRSLNLLWCSRLLACFCAVETPLRLRGRGLSEWSDMAWSCRSSSALATVPLVSNSVGIVGMLKQHSASCTSFASCSFTTREAMLGVEKSQTDRGRSIPRLAVRCHSDERLIARMLNRPSLQCKPQKQLRKRAEATAESRNSM